MSGTNVPMRLFNLVTPVDATSPDWWGDAHLVNEDTLYSSSLTSSMFSDDADDFRGYAKNIGPAPGQPAGICNAADPGLTPFDREQLCLLQVGNQWHAEQWRGPSVLLSQLRSIANDVPMCETHIKFSRHSGWSDERNTDVINGDFKESFTLHWSTDAAFTGGWDSTVNDWTGASGEAEYTATIPWSGCSTVGEDWVSGRENPTDTPKVC